jgi:iron complex transport system permease protein
VLVAALVAGAAMGPVGIPLSEVIGSVIAHLPWHPHMAVPPIDSAIVWQIRLPRVVLGALVGAMLAGGGAAYQGVFRNPLADPYLLGVAAGAGLGATMLIVVHASPAALPPAAFTGAAFAVVLTYSLGAGSGRHGDHAPLAEGTGGTASILLAGIAIAALFTAGQTYLQQAHTQDLQSIYGWILGGLSGATWGQVTLILPYVAISAGVLIVHRRLLDVLRVGEAEAGALGVNVPQLRLTVVAAATLGTAAAVSVSGLIGFVGIIVPHLVRLTAGPSYRIVLPVSMIGGAAFLVLTDIGARTLQAPAEIPIGVLTAAIGGPFFLFVLRSRHARKGASIRAEHLAVRFGATAALNRVSLDVAAGEWVGLIGPNGAGKTTLLRAVARMLHASGRVLLAGRDAASLSRRKLARLIGYVPQHPELPPDMTGASYVLLGRTPHIGYFGTESDADRRICADLLDRMDLAHMAGRRLGSLSGGEAQRIVLARALAQQAPILLLDEPTSSLDLGRRLEALELVDELRREHSLTVLSAIHDLTLAGQFADRLVLLAHGEIAASGEPAAVLRDDALSQAFGTGVQVLRTPDGDLAVITHRQARSYP